MPTLIIDHQSIEVPQGTKVIEAAERLGIMIPRFCYHVALGAVGACRLCAVMFVDGPLKGLHMSCMVEALEGMVVSTTDAEAVDFRRQVIEWLMLHHPHDCPVCDEGGHCLLQDHTESSGHALRRYRGPKRTHIDQDLGPLLQHEMNRCIQCYRCSRFYQEFTGYGDLAAMGIGSKVYFGRHSDGTLESPYAGNLADICPTGVFTDKPSRYIGRRWDYQRTPSVCINCSLGCNTTVSASYREVVRLEARFNPVVNGHFICDRGRHGFTYTSAAQRPRKFRVDDRDADASEALRKAGERLADVSRRHGRQAVACMGSMRSSLEAQGALARLCQVKGWMAPVFFDDEDRLAAVQAALASPDLQVSMRAIESADLLLLVGCDPVHEAPMLALALRQAQRRGAAVICLDPRPVDLPLDFRHVAVDVDQTAAWLAELTRIMAAGAAPAGVRGGDEESHDLTVETAQKLFSSRRPVIVCGTDVTDAAAVMKAAALARALNGTGRKAGWFPVLPGANALSAALLSEGGRSIASLVTGIAEGQVKALLVVETDPLWHTSDRQFLANALNHLELLVVMDYLDGPHCRAADMFLPTTTIFESGGTFVNQEWRAQNAFPSLTGGTPIRITGGGGHPPRMYGQGLPGDDPLPAWRMLSALAEEDGFVLSADILAWLAARIPGFIALTDGIMLPPEGFRLSNDNAADAPPRSKARRRAEGDAPCRADALDLITGELTFGSEEMSCRSPQLLKLEPPPRAAVSAIVAQRLNLNEGDRIAIAADAGRIEVDLSVSNRMAPGVLLLPRHHRLDWQRLGGRRVRLSFDRIKKIMNEQVR